MSILIKGMEMPKSCWECKLTDKKQPPKSCIFKSWYTLSRDDKPSTCNWCPLIYIPPHGRLIDADVLLEEIYKLRMWLLENNMPGAEHWVTKTYQMVDEMPTIIEAEE